jgi:hypothetical protein
VIEHDQHPWHRLIEEGEGTKAYEAANMYFLRGPGRSIASVGLELGKSEGLLGRWSRTYRWVERAAQWDDHAASLERHRNELERREARRRMLDRHARVGQRAASIASSWLDEFGEGGSKTASELTASEAVRLLEVAARVERESRPSRWSPPDEAAAREFAGSLIDVALRHVPAERADAFLADLCVAVGAEFD